MTDFKPDIPVEVNPSTAVALASTAIRYIVVLLAGVAALLGLASKGDLAGIIAYLQSEEGLSLGAAVIAVGTFVWGLYSKWRAKQKLVVLARSAPIGQVKGE